MFVKFIDESTIQVLPQNGEMMIPHTDEDGNTTYNREGVSNMSLFCEENPDVANYNGIYELDDSGEIPEDDYYPYYVIENNKVVQMWRLGEEA